jgi:UDP-glucose 4-epimerase
MEHVHRLSDARVVITGGAGLIGSHGADLLVRANAGEIVIFDNLSRGRVENLVSARSQG